MTQKKQIKLFSKPIWKRSHPVGSGEQRVYKFKNGYGASVVRFLMPKNNYLLPTAELAKKFIDRDGNMRYASYTDNENEWELAVVKFPKESKDGKIFDLDYSTSITHDVIGHLLEKDVEKLLIKISKLK